MKTGVVKVHFPDPADYQLLDHVVSLVAPILSAMAHEFAKVELWPDVTETPAERHNRCCAFERYDCNPHLSAMRAAAKVIVLKTIGPRGENGQVYWAITGFAVSLLQAEVAKYLNAVG